jgi:hypothetical protein
MRRLTVSILVLTALLVSVAVAATTPMKALISGVPRYYQADMRVGSSCWFPSGCGPVAGASVCAWWDKRGFPNLIDDDERESDGLPQQAIVDLGAAHYMNRDTSCAQSWVLPGAFAEGLEDYMNDHLGTRAGVVRFEVIRYRITDSGYEIPDTGATGGYDELFEIVRNEIWNGRPMVYLFRYDGAENADGTFKVADHYGVVVGYDQTDGSRRLVIQANQSTDPLTAVTGYQNVYIGSNRYLRLGDHTKNSAAVRYHLYAVRPVPASAVEIGLGAAPLLLDSSQVDNTMYHVNGNDGVATSWFEPKLDQSDVFSERLWHDHDDWGKTDEIILQDGVCFVAGWRTTGSESPSSDSDGDGVSDEVDKPDVQPVYVRTHIDTMSTSSIKLTVFVELRNLGHAREPFYGPLAVHWERVETGTAIQPIRSPVSGSGTPIAVHPLYPDSSTETVSWSGQSTLYLEHSWQLDRDAWDGSDGFVEAFTFRVTVDPEDAVDELDEANNVFTFTAGSWSPETGFGGPLLRIREIYVSPDVRDRIGLVKARAWRMTPVDASVIGDPSFYAISLATVNASEIAAALTSADHGDLLIVTVASAGVVFVDVGQ